MENKDIMKTVKPETLSNILKNKYKSFCITGGEPLCDSDTFHLMKLVALSVKGFNPITPIYLYTNGVNLNEKNISEIIDLFDGINIGLHNEIDYAKIKWISRCIPTRLHRWEKKIDKKLLDFCKDNGIMLKIWKKDVCHTEKEDRFILV
jgi:organic radical activating enzyme